MQILTEWQKERIVYTIGKLLDTIEELDSEVYYKSDEVMQANDIIKELE